MHRKDGYASFCTLWSRRLSTSMPTIEPMKLFYRDASTTNLRLDCVDGSCEPLDVSGCDTCD